MNISILKKRPSLTEKVAFMIRPLAPLSMVSEMPGSYYKSLRYPNKKMLCGLIENIIGWHFNAADRKAILKMKKRNNLDDSNYAMGSTYIPLLMDYFDISGKAEILQMKSMCFYKDLWNRGYRRKDSYKHINGCRNIDKDILAEYHMLFQKIDAADGLSSKDKSNMKQSWFNNNLGKIPFYYTTPSQREYIGLDGIYCFHFIMDPMLYQMLSTSLKENNLGYLGNSEGWVDLNLNKE